MSLNNIRDDDERAAVEETRERRKAVNVGAQEKRAGKRTSGGKSKSGTTEG